MSRWIEQDRRHRRAGKEVKFIAAPEVDQHQRSIAAFFGRALEPILKGSFICNSDTSADNRAVNFRRATVSVHRGNRGLAAVRTTLAMLLLITLSLPIAWGSDKDDHERARAAVQAGAVLPLPTLLERLQRTHPGQVLELELELDRDNGRWIYEVKLLQANGQLLKLELDARTGQVLKLKRKGDRKAMPPKDPPK